MAPGLSSIEGSGQAPGAPTVDPGNIERARDGAALSEKTDYAGAIRQDKRTKAERRHDAGEKAPKRCARYVPLLNLEFGHIVGNMQETGPRRLRQRVEPVFGRGSGCAVQPRRARRGRRSTAAPIKARR